jgi:hypothetical protein
MEIEVVGLAGAAFAVATSLRLIYERRMDVLHGPYIADREAGAFRAVLAPAMQMALGKANVAVRNLSYLACAFA